MIYGDSSKDFCVMLMNIDVVSTTHRRLGCFREKREDFGSTGSRQT